MRKLLLPATALIGACATPTTGVVPVADGYYTVVHQGSSALVTTSNLKASALTEASAHCESKGKTIQVINVKEIPAGPFGRWPEAEATFTCK